MQLGCGIPCYPDWKRQGYRWQYQAIPRIQELPESSTSNEESDKARRTVVVLSETYLTDRMAEFENTLVQTMGIQEGTYRLLPVRATPIDTSRLPVRLSMLTTLDLSHPRRAEREFNRLIQALQESLPRM